MKADSDFRKKEYEAQHFGFLPKVYNEIIECWAKIVEKELMPALPLDDVDEEMKEQLKTSFIQMIGENNVLNSVINKTEEYFHNYFFHIPNHVTLPHDLPNLHLPKNWTAKSAMHHIEALRKEIIDVGCMRIRLFWFQLRYKIAILEKETEDNEYAEKLLSALQSLNN
ncbi:unnamed protein product, partial [Gongylonema pulchrum]|uniref:DHC_N2 domain-containing protein n=1 Tax=Gongylonema pulchrum TaxID=637853 RepID=A0A183DZX4_9BILA